MLSSYLKCKKIYIRNFLKSTCAVCNSKRSRFIKESDTKWLRSKLETKNGLSEILLINDLL